MVFLNQPIEVMIGMDLSVLSHALQTILGATSSKHIQAVSSDGLEGFCGAFILFNHEYINLQN